MSIEVHIDWQGATDFTRFLVEEMNASAEPTGATPTKRGRKTK